MPWNVEDTISILNEGTIPNPRCENCDMFISREVLWTGHLGTEKYNRGLYQENRFCTDAATWETARMEFRAQDHVLERVEKFKYLSRLLLPDDSDWQEVAGNICKVGRKLERFYCMLIQEGSDPWLYRWFYVAVVKYVVLFGSEIWVVTPCILRGVGSLHNQAARQISYRIPQRLQNRRWD